MSQGDSSNSSSEDSLAAVADSPLCIICDEAAAGVGPFSRTHLCQEHLAIDVADGRQHQRDVKEELRPYSEGVSVRAAALLEEQLELSRQLTEIEERFAALLQSLNEWKTRVTEKLTARREAVQTCLRDCEDVVSYDREVMEAEAAGNMAEVCNLALAMQLSVPDLRADFERARRLRDEGDGAELRGLRTLQRMVASLAGGADATDAAVTARPETSDAAVTAGGIIMSHELKLDDWITWVTVCNDTSGFRSDRTGRVVPTESAGDGSMALPQPCLVAKVMGKDHLTVLSVDGTVRLRTQCVDINWNDEICGFNSDPQFRALFIAQSAAVTVTDLSGRVIGRIHPRTLGFRSIGGIGGNAASVFVSSGNKIAAISKATGKRETVMTLHQLPDADLRNLTIHGNCLLVTDWKHQQVHRVRTDTQQLVATHPNQGTGLARFQWPWDVATDSRGRVFVSEGNGHSVRAVTADDGSLLWTLGVPGESGSGRNRLNGPRGLAVVTGGPCEQLVVADRYNKRLLVLNLH